MVSEYVGIPISYALTDAVPVGKFIDKYFAVYYTVYAELKTKANAVRYSFKNFYDGRVGYQKEDLLEIVL